MAVKGTIRRRMNKDGSTTTSGRRVSRTESAPVLVDLTKSHKTRTVPVDQGTLETLRRFHASAVERAEFCGVALHPEAHLFSSSADGTVFWQPVSVEEVPHDPPTPTTSST